MAASKMFDRPIPGQSLTDTPKNAPYERPPEIVDPELALQVHLARLNDADRMEGIMYTLEMGVDLVTLVEGILRGAVLNGIHTIDVSLIIAPVIHEFIKSTADELGVEYEEGFEDAQGKKESRYAANTMVAEKKIKELGFDKRRFVKDISVEDIKADKLEAPEPMEEPEEKPQGLMARRN